MPRGSQGVGDGVGLVVAGRQPDEHATPTREQNKLKATQAQTVIAAAILRHLHAVITTGRAWDPEIATHGIRGRNPTELAA